MEEHIKEVKTSTEANLLIEEHNYRVDRYSESRDCYILFKRLKK